MVLTGKRVWYESTPTLILGVPPVFIVNVRVEGSYYRDRIISVNTSLSGVVMCHVLQVFQLSYR